MTKNILWRGLSTESLEYCSISYRDVIRVRSSVIGHHEELPFKAEYEIELEPDWRVRSFLIRSSISNIDQNISLKHNGYGRWFHDNKEWPQLEGCIDIDISVTPFTNSLPINRLKPGALHTSDIHVVYIDLPSFRIRKECQHYTRLDQHIYRFANDSGDFTEDITVDNDGLVVQYPGLFERVLLQE